MLAISVAVVTKMLDAVAGSAPSCSWWPCSAVAVEEVVSASIISLPAFDDQEISAVPRSATGDVLCYL
jgi:hypothetical protein